jgi:hypothetical protein
MKGWHDSPQPRVTIMQDGDDLLIIPTAYADRQPYPLPVETVARIGSGYDKFGRIARQALWRAQDKTEELSKERARYIRNKPSGAARLEELCETGRTDECDQERDEMRERMDK